jgi:hypothetical protein
LGGQRSLYLVDSTGNEARNVLPFSKNVGETCRETRRCFDGGEVDLPDAVCKFDIGKFDNSLKERSTLIRSTFD